MQPIQAPELLDLADSQWVSLSELQRALERTLDQSSDTTKQLIAALSIETVRPARIVSDHGTGVMLLDDLNTKNNETINTLVGHQSLSKQERAEAPDSIRYLSDGAIIEFSKPALHQWLIDCDLAVAAKKLFGTWMKEDYPRLCKSNLLIGKPNAEGNKPSKLSNNTLTLTYEQLKTLSGKNTPADTKAWLVSKGIEFYSGARGRPCTTIAAFNKGLGLDTSASNDSDNPIKRPKRKIEV